MSRIEWCLTKYADKIYKNKKIINEEKNLKFRLLEIPTEGKEFTNVYDVAEVVKSLEEREYKQSRPLAPLEVRVHMIRSERQVFARGWIIGRMELTCSRCLEPFGMTIQLEFQQTFFPYSKPLNSGEMGLSADDLDVTYYSGEEVDLTHIIWDELILGIQFSPLCRQDCKGLCPRCGANLNKGKCLCPPKSVAFRWEALRQIKF